MSRGKQTCRILKAIRQQIARANDVDFITSECHYKGDCLGTCPKCEAEVRYLEEQLRLRQSMGKAVVIAGLSAGLIGLSGCGSTAHPLVGGGEILQSEPTEQFKSDTPIHTEKHDDSESAIFGAISEVMPQFPGGEGELLRFVAENIKYPEEYCNAQGRVIVQFLVDKNGNVCTPKIVRSNLPEAFNQEALRIINLFPKFSPGTINGVPVDIRYMVPVRFSAPSD